MSTNRTSAIALKFYEAPMAEEFNAMAVRSSMQTLMNMVDSSSKESANGQAAGRVSAFSPKPETHPEKVARILKQIDKGDLVLAKGVFEKDIIQELSKGKYAGMSVKEMVSELKDSKFLKSEPRPAPALKLKTLDLKKAFAMPVPAY